MDAFLESLSGCFPFLSPHSCLTHILKDISCVVTQTFDELKSFIVLQNFFSKIASKIWFSAIAMKLINHLYAFIKVFDVFSTMMTGNFNVDVSINNEIEPAFKFK
jgi:hypothetical protein